MIKRILMVCLGNICRSPAAEAVIKQKLKEAGFTDICVDSAGTASWHQGKPADHRSIQVGKELGYDLSTIRSRPVQLSDFVDFDLILAMDWDNYSNLVDLASTEYFDKIQLLMPFSDPSLKLKSGLPDLELLSGSNWVVPDPYYGDIEGFREMYTLIESAFEGLLCYIKGKEN